MFHSPTDDLRIEHLRPLLPPAILMEEIPTQEEGFATVAKARQGISSVLHAKDKRLVLVVGPCSIHDPDAALEYAGRLKGLADRYSNELLVVMRTYFEKPRTTVGWKGLINDPDLDGSFAINKGLRVARRFLRDVVESGLPTGIEFLDPISPQFVADLVSWGAIGARTSESQVHRELASGLSMPVGFKNGTRGTVQIALDAIRSSRHSHQFLSVTKQGITAIVKTRGNMDCHMILRGGKDAPNYYAENVAECGSVLNKLELPPKVMVDCSHANSGKDHIKQEQVALELAKRIGEGEEGILGVMLESFLVDGRQNCEDPKKLTRGQSITDACMGWERSEKVLEALANGVAKGR